MLLLWKVDTASQQSIAGCGRVLDPGLGDGSTTASRCCGLWTSTEPLCSRSSTERAASVVSSATGWRVIVLVRRDRTIRAVNAPWGASRAVERGVRVVSYPGPRGNGGAPWSLKMNFLSPFLGWKQKLIIQILIFSRQRIFFIHGWGSLQGAPWASFPGPQSGSQRAWARVLAVTLVNGRAVIKATH